MRPSLRFLTARLPAFTPTGLTGTLTHPHPRPTLIALYNHTLNILSQMPEHSIYRKSTEALTKQRLNIVRATVPEGYKQWEELCKRHNLPTGEPDIKTVGAWMRKVLADEIRNDPNETVKIYIEEQLKHLSTIPWPTEYINTVENYPKQMKEILEAEKQGQIEGQTDPKAKEQELAAKNPDEDWVIQLEPELTAEQVQEVENKIDEGLIEEVVEQGWHELKCAEAMLEDRAWEPLEHPAVEGQWVGYDRPGEAEQRPRDQHN